ncbi:hypothetical protein ABW19_dt0208524 [Dactylella cylindrospora]|nr:hypothetical protein ABW19_dt0208524 [Dactylella cylindrospora]
MPDPKRVKLYYSDPLDPDSEDYDEDEDEEGEESEEEVRHSIRNVIEISDDSEHGEEPEKRRKPQDEGLNPQGHTNRAEAKGLYRELLKADSYIGNFAFSQTYSSTPNPGLYINGFGLLRLPISPENAKEIFRIGNGASNLPIDAVKEIDAAGLSCRNPAWGEWLDRITEEASKTLGIVGELRVTLSLEKLRVYGSGELAGLNGAEPREPQRVGTLELTLPSEFDGGMISLSHKSEKMDMEVFQACQYNIGIGAWYWDVSRVYSPITKGYKVTLVYGLTTQTRHDLSAGKVCQTAALLDAVKEIRDSEEPVAYILREEYSTTAQKNLGFRGSDLFIVRNLIQAVNKVGSVALYCGDLISDDSKEVGEYGEEDDYDDEVDEEDYEDRDMEYISHSLENMTHLAGTIRDFGRSNGFGSPILTFGSKLSEIDPFDSTMEWHRGYGQCETSRSKIKTLLVQVT